MATKLLSNLPIEELTPDTDYLGIIDKADLIKAFLKGNEDQFNQIKMFSLYGEWGSGKSSLMKYLKKELEADFNTFFFEAWEFEKDENLAMSLLEFITLKYPDVEEGFYKDIVKYGGRILRGLGKSVKLSTPLFPGGPSAEFDMTGFIDEFKAKEDISFYKALENFKTEFVRLEDKLTKGAKKYNVVFIDDLDRCEPEQVLNLLSAIKLFFTYGKKTVFFCGIDKKAAEQAVKTKYGEIVKSGEYLEKIFDISFSMPMHDNFQKLINHYFDETLYSIGGSEIAINSRIYEFFRSLKFTNPRRIKKVLNKFQLFRNIRSLEIYEPFPNIDEKNGSQASFFETIVLLYLIVLHEFYPKAFDNFLNFDFKRKNYFEAIKKWEVSTNIHNIQIQLNTFFDKNMSNAAFSKIEINQDNIPYYTICLSPSILETISTSSLHDARKLNQMIVKNNRTEFFFYKLIMDMNLIPFIKDSGSDSSLHQMKKLIRTVA